MAKKNKQRTKEPMVIEHAPAPVVPKIFTVDIVYESGREVTFTQVLSTVCDHEHGEENPPVVPYYNYMIVQQLNGTSSYVNMEKVEDLTITEVKNG